MQNLVADLTVFDTPHSQSYTFVEKYLKAQRPEKLVEVVVDSGAYHVTMQRDQETMTYHEAFPVDP